MRMGMFNGGFFLMGCFFMMGGFFLMGGFLGFLFGGFLLGFVGMLWFFFYL